MQSGTTVSYYLISLVEGNIELQQKVWYHMDTMQLTNLTKNVERNVIVESPSHQSHSHKLIEKPTHLKNHSMSIDYVDNGVVKVKDDTVILSCIEEFSFNGQFYALNKQPLTKAYRNEDFLFRASIDIKAPCSIDILDMFLICVS